MRIILRWLLAGALLAAATATADENADFGVAPVATLRLANLSAPTPREVPGAKTIRTAELRDRLRAAETERPLLFDVLGGEQHDSLPGAIWLPGAGRGNSYDDAVQAQLARLLQAASKGDAGRAIVFFCQGTACWLSYNAALRAVALDYREVYWYRGGIEAWLAGGGPLAPLRFSWRKPAP
jgi:PQQ-dependent catabolism-associated CXXCW motif protein